MNLTGGNLSSGTLYSYLRKSIQDKKIFLLAWCIIASFFLVKQVNLVSHPKSWTKSEGHEYVWIADSIAAGKGFSFPSERRWMFQTDQGKPDLPEYYPTAWKEPLYPYFLGSTMRMLGPNGGRVVVVAFQVMALALTIFFTYLLGNKLMGPWTGLLAAGLLSINSSLATAAATSLNTSVIGAMIITGTLLIIIYCMEEPKVRRAAALGVCIGLGALVLAPIMMLGLVAAIGLIITSIQRRTLRPMAMVPIIALISMLIIAPWTLRNFKTFGLFIPVQTGLGNFSNFANTYLAETFMPELALDPHGSPPPWISKGPHDAVRKLRIKDNSTALIFRSLESVDAVPPIGWELMNEPQRDHVHLMQFKSFVTEHPRTFLNIVFYKAIQMFVSAPKATLVLSLFAVGGLFLTLRRQAVYLLPLSVLMLSAPLLVTAPLHYRYRLPFEPLIIILSAGAVVAFTEALLRRFLGRVDIGINQIYKGLV